MSGLSMNSIINFSYWLNFSKTGPKNKKLGGIVLWMILVMPQNPHIRLLGGRRAASERSQSN